MSEIKVNKISPKQTCTQVTLGDSGDTFTIPAGVTLTNNGTATGFGPTGAVSWNTTKITSDPNPAVSGVGYFADTSSAAFTVTLPATPSAGDIVALQDYAGTWGTNNVTIGRNGSNIGGVAVDPTLSTSDQSITLVYVDSTRGWQTVNDSTQSIVGAQYVTATGGTITCCGDYKIHTFTSPGTFTVTCAGNPLGSTLVDYLVSAGGGGGGGGYQSGGGGAGGLRASDGTTSGCYSAGPSPLVGCVSALPVSVTTYPVTVGGGGPGGAAASPNNCGNRGTNGNNSIFSSITSAGGGSGGVYTCGISSPFQVGGPGGSGGGSGRVSSGTYPGGTGNTPPVSPAQGQNGGLTTTPYAIPFNGGGGGGAIGGGGPGQAACFGVGGVGAASSITGSAINFSGGGGSGGQGPASTGSPCGTGGDGASAPGNQAAQAGTTNRGGGGGGGNISPGIPTSAGGNGGSGIVIIRYKFQN
jgi:hypothetical protein